MRRANLQALCGLLLMVAAAQAADAIPWQSDYRQAAEVAARERKLILLHFWSDDCPPCRKLEANVFPRSEVAKAITSAYVPVKVHVDSSPELARRYQVTRWPTDVIVTPAGLEVYRTVSPQDPARYVAMLQQTATQSGAALASNPSPAQAARPSAAAQPAAYQPSPANAAAANSASEFQPAAHQDMPVKPTQAAPSQAGQPSDGQAQLNPYVLNPRTSGEQRGAPAMNTAPTRPGDSGYESEFIPGGGGSVTSAPSIEQESGAPPPAPRMPAYTGPTSSGPAQPTAGRPQENPHVAKPRDTNPSAAQPRLPPLGMEGFCVITLAEKGGWARGDKRFGAIHRGRLYLFASPEAQRTFLADPDRYSPALSGFDPVQFAESGGLVDGKRAHGVRLESNGQVYLFANEDSLRKFQASPKQYVETVYQAMLKSDSGSKYR